MVQLETWLRDQRTRLSPNSETAKAINYILNRWTALTRFLDDGRLCMSNNAAERALRGIATGRHNWTFAGSDEGGRRAGAIYTLVETGKLNGINPQAWLTDVLARLPDHPARRINDLLPWNWQPQNLAKAALPPALDPKLNPACGPRRMRTNCMSRSRGLPPARRAALCSWTLSDAALSPHRARRRNFQPRKTESPFRRAVSHRRDRSAVTGAKIMPPKSTTLFLG